MLGYALIFFLTQIDTYSYFRFDGIYLLMHIPRRIVNGRFIIVNVKILIDSVPSRHWIVIVNNNDTYEIYDSLGYQKSLKQYLFTIRSKYQNIVYNRKQFQSDSSSLCGFYSLYFIHKRLKNRTLPFGRFLQQIFYRNPIRNDCLIQDFKKWNCMMAMRNLDLGHLM